ncbi:hypothetical protein MASR2M52_09710 [Pedobacter sp.]
MLSFSSVYSQLGKTEYLKGEAARNKENWIEALKWLKISAEKGYPKGMNSLAYMYENGEGMDQNYPEAMKWYRKSIQKGNTDAMVSLGIIYQNSDLYEEAENCFKMSAEKGNINGMDLLGYFYFTREKYKEALPWLKKAAEKDQPTALYHLGEMYEYGYGGIQIDETKALEYYKKAASKGDENAIKRLKTN